MVHYQKKDIVQNAIMMDDQLKKNNTMTKYRGRKKYTEKEAQDQIENTMQLYYTNIEALHTWKTQPRDLLIEALTGTKTEEAIRQVELQNEYLMNKIEYMRQFAPNYQLKGSFAFFSV